MEPQTDFLLSVEGLVVSFDGFRAVDDLSFYLDRNEIRVIIGPNGAGKTTVLDLICGRTKATKGSVKFKGLELTKMKEHEIVRAGVGRKFQTPSIYEDLTVFENLEAGATIDEIMEWFHLNREQIVTVLEFAARSLDPFPPPQAATRSTVNAHPA